MNNLDNLFANIQQAILALPNKVGTEAVNYALDNFKKQSFDGQPWRQRKNPNKWKQAPKRNSRALLVDTGRLRRSLRIIRLESDTVVVGSDVPYAQAHNDGVRLAEIQQVKEYTRKINTIATVSSIKTKKARKQKVQTGITTVKAHTRRINQNIPARPFLKESPYLTARIKRIIAAEIMKAAKLTSN